MASLKPIPLAQFVEGEMGDGFEGVDVGLVELYTA